MLYMAHSVVKRKRPIRYDDIAAIAVLLSRGALVPMVQPADFRDLNDPASL